MAKYSRIAVAQTMIDTGLVPLFYHNDVEASKKVLKACYDGGARLLEFTNRGDFAHEVFAELNKYALRELPGMILGVGSVTDAGAASLYMQLGANFLDIDFPKNQNALQKLQNEMEKLNSTSRVDAWSGHPELRRISIEAKAAYLELKELIDELQKCIS